MKQMEFPVAMTTDRDGSILARREEEPFAIARCIKSYRVCVKALRNGVCQSCGVAFKAKKSNNNKKKRKYSPVCSTIKLDFSDKKDV